MVAWNSLLAAAAVEAREDLQSRGFQEERWAEQRAFHKVTISWLACKNVQNQTDNFMNLRRVWLFIVSVFGWELSLEAHHNDRNKATIPKVMATLFRPYEAPTTPKCGECSNDTTSTVGIMLVFEISSPTHLLGSMAHSPSSCEPRSMCMPVSRQAEQCNLS